MQCWFSSFWTILVPDSFRELPAEVTSLCWHWNRWREKPGHSLHPTAGELKAQLPQGWWMHWSLSVLSDRVCFLSSQMGKARIPKMF